jgi:hypothetical protein
VTIEQQLADICKAQEMAIPKDKHTGAQVTSIYGTPMGETQDCWLVRCSHSLNKPASVAEIAQAEEALGLLIPQEYQNFITIANGAELFSVPVVCEEFPQPHIRYRLFGTKDLVDYNVRFLQRFRAHFADDPKYKEARSLNYLAICDAYDGNYQAVLLEGRKAGIVFLLFRESLRVPYDETEAEFYYTIADSFEQWLELIHKTKGWGGRGRLTAGL